MIVHMYICMCNIATTHRTVLYQSIWGRCYDHNFLRFLTIFGEKMAFFSKTNVMIKILHYLALV
jgi:hypothetical protein